MSTNWLRLSALTTKYDREARLVPALASFLPGLPLPFVLNEGASVWRLLLLGLGTTGLAVLASFVLVQVASAMGNRLQRKLWPDWPFDAPTNVRLMPTYAKTSPQQRARWYAQVKELTGIDVQAEVDRGNESSVRVTVNDAVERLRNRFRRRAATRTRHDQESIRYGATRNFTGMRSIWLSLAILSCATSWTTYVFEGTRLYWATGTSIVLVALCYLAFAVLPDLVRTRAPSHRDRRL